MRCLVPHPAIGNSSTWRGEGQAGQAVLSRREEWVQYGTPDPEGAEYVAICVPAFSPATVHRDDA